MRDGNKEKLLYSGSSLEESLKVKNRLQANGIAFTEKSKKHDSWFRFILLMFIGTGSYGMHGERVVDYTIYVDHDVYENARKIIDRR